ncbi:MAG: AI-2E family transporter [Dehalococcoidia bacterium]|nr:MAG: AI-2E family transporter [Dehalococcoidia bacterium]
MGTTHPRGSRYASGWCRAVAGRDADPNGARCAAFNIDGTASDNGPPGGLGWDQTGTRWSSAHLDRLVAQPLDRSEPRQLMRRWGRWGGRANARAGPRTLISDDAVGRRHEHMGTNLSVRRRLMTSCRPEEIAPSQVADEPAHDRRVPAVEPPLPAWLVLGAAAAWRLLTIALVLALIVLLASRLRVVLLPVFFAVLLATLIVPPVKWLERHGVPHRLAAWCVLSVTATLTVLLVTLLSTALIDEAGALRSTLAGGVDRIARWFVDGPLHLQQSQVDGYVSQIRAEFRANGSRLLHGAVNTAPLAIEVSVGALLTVVLAFFFVHDGERIVKAGIDLAPPGRRPLLGELARRVWLTLTSYGRGTVANGAVNAALMALGLTLIGVPLVVPIAALTLLGGFVPVLGAFASGGIAAVIALAENGPRAALLVVVLTTVIHTVEGYLVGPLVLGRAVHLNPLAVLFAVAVGSTVAGVMGAIIAVPLTAAAVSALAAFREHSRTPVSSGHSPPSLTDGTTDIYG